MNAAEIKLDLFRRIDGLESSKLERVYEKIIGLLGADQQKGNTLSPELIEALDEALEASNKGKTHSHEEVMNITNAKYPNLF
ncbi:MAG: hypothetical protein M0P66_00920 [Salinivirgaceae bacterium]|nr:hypothetical protein [Salinivirgaceae bacterium]